MATRSENETIEAIKHDIVRAANSKKDIPIALSKDKDYYRKAISSVSNTGLFTMFSAGVALIASLLYSFSYYSENGYPSVGYVIGVAIGELLVCAIPFIIGYKLHELDTTPNFIMFLLILALIINLLLSAGVLPFIALISNILALSRWSTYKDWFYTYRDRK